MQLRVLPDGWSSCCRRTTSCSAGHGQSYLGCGFPADPAYSRYQRARHSVGGLAGSACSADSPSTSSSCATRRRVVGVAIEFNLRKGGTTHPFLTLQFLTDGRYDGEAGGFLTPGGATKHLVATDHLEADQLRGFCGRRPVRRRCAARSAFRPGAQTGVVFHMISSLIECGRVGMTAVGSTPEQAWELYQDAQDTLLAEADSARAEGALIG